MNGSNQELYLNRILKKLTSQSQLYNDFAASELRSNLDKIPLWRGNDVAIRQLREDFAKYLYLPKLAGAHLLQQAIETGIGLIAWEKDSFAYAESYDQENSRYRGLQAGARLTISLDSYGLVVSPIVAKEQLEKEREEAQKKIPIPGNGAPGPWTANEGDDIQDQPTPTPPAKPVKSRFFGNIDIDAIRFFRDAESVEKEILKHLSSIKGTNLKISIHIEATNKDGFSEETERTIKENGRTLGFGSVEFE
jgi:hypothetical protein